MVPNRLCWGLGYGRRNPSRVGVSYEGGLSSDKDIRAKVPKYFFNELILSEIGGKGAERRTPIFEW